jgi:hypothetical protein
LTSKEALRIRTQLATDTQTQLTETSTEIDTLIKFVIVDESEKAFSELQQRYDDTYTSINYQYKSNPELAERNIAILSANYAKGIQKTQENLMAEAVRLSMISSKVLAGAKAVDAINKMANDEIMLYDNTMSQFVSTITSQSILDIIKSYSDKHYSAKLKEN